MTAPRPKRPGRPRRPGLPGPGPDRIRLAGTLLDRGELTEAARLLEQVTAQEPGHRAAWWLLRTVLARKGDWKGLRTVLETLVRLDPPGDLRDFYEAHLRLLFGDLRRGWELYEARRRLPDLTIDWQWSQPEWDGRPFPGKTLLLHWEQGLGDTLMFVRYAARAKALGGRVVLLAQPELADLAGTCPGVDQVFSHRYPTPPHDFWAPLLSLPHRFGTDLDSIPCEVPYLDVPDQVPNRLAITTALAASAGRTRVGLAWAGSAKHPRDQERSLPASALAPLGGLPGVAWHSFQIEPGSAPPLPGLVDLAPLLANFSDTAYALSGMDLVITVDTALAHLAGALGIPALVLLAFGPDSRWLLHRPDSPWYPSLRLYRQPRPGDWDPVLEALARDLGA